MDRLHARVETYFEGMHLLWLQRGHSASSQSRTTDDAPDLRGVDYGLLYALTVTHIHILQ